MSRRRSPITDRGIVPAMILLLFMAGAPAMAQGGGTDSGGAEQTHGGSAEGVSIEELDLREANVTGVAIETSATGRYRFDVTLIHDDAGEEGYADWWQVESLDGRRLGRRTLLHAHGTVEFTRSETIEIPEGIGRVLVRGHDQTHGYGGQAVLVNLRDGALEFVDQGREPEDFSNRMSN